MRAPTALPHVPFVAVLAPAAAWLADATAGAVETLMRAADAFDRRAERRRELTALERLDDHLLRDLGLSRGDVDMMIRHGGERP